MSTTPLGPGREFDLIRRILEGTDVAGLDKASGPGDRRAPHAADRLAPDAADRLFPEGAGRLALGPGDDCALLAIDDGYLALTLDLSVEDVHFRRGWGTAEEIAGRAVRAALSDLAAMAADPVGILVAVHVAKDDDPELAWRLGTAARETAEGLGAALLGGDLSRGGAGLALDVAAVGRVERPLLRSGARPGDGLWVTGELGAAAAAVGAWVSGAEPEPGWRERFWQPAPRLREASWLAGRGAAAAIDLSDGLAADAGHLAAASGVGIEIDLEAVPAAEGVDPEAALSGGEDYELLLAAPADILAAEPLLAEFRDRFGLPLTRVGRVVSGEGVRLYRGDEELELASPGFDHFA